MTTLDVCLLNKDAKTPTCGSSFSVGYDLYSSEEKVVTKRQRCMVSTGIAIGIPTGTYGRVAPRSGLAAKHGIDVGAGVLACVHICVWACSWARTWACVRGRGCVCVCTCVCARTRFCMRVRVCRSVYYCCCCCFNY